MALEESGPPETETTNPAQEAERPLAMPGSPAIRHYALKFVDAVDIAPILSARFNPPGDSVGTSVFSADSRTNSLIVVSSSADQVHIEKAIQELDIQEVADEIAQERSAIDSGDGRRVLESHTYDLKTRQSTDWVEINGTGVPVDNGVEHGGIRVYVTLMFDVVAVDGKSEKMVWSIDWNKTMPMWSTVSIVELDRGGKTELAVELYAAVGKTGEQVFEYVSLATGEKIEPPAIATGSGEPSTNSQRDKEKELRFQTIDRDDQRITRAAIGAFGHGRSATELVRHFAARDHDITRFKGGSSVTNMETLVSAVEANYLLGEGMDAPEVIFNLPEGSGMRAEFSGEIVEITKGKDSTTVVITGGRIALIDAGGVVRAQASPDGGAEQLVIECREELGEVVMQMATRRIVPSPDYPDPPVQVAMNTETGAPKDEEDPPHREIRYEIQQGDAEGKPIVRMKMKWRYDLKRLAEEATSESGLTLEDLIFGRNDDPQQENPTVPDTFLPDESGNENRNMRDQTDPDDLQGASEWGALAEHSGLRSRLTLQTGKPVVGQPMLFKLEVKNFGAKPTGVDAQRYYPFRVLRAIQHDGKTAKFIGMTPQTSGEEQQLQPGETLVLWENVDINSLFLLISGRYRFFAEGGEWATQTLWRDSNTVEVEIAAGEQSPLNRLIGELGKNLPDKWNVYSGMGLTEGWKGVFLTHLPTNLKRDATGIQIWFTDEKLADDFALGKGDQKQIVTQLGKCEPGFMNVAAQPKTPEIWPKYLEHIRRAATASLTFEADSDPGQLPWSAEGTVTDREGKPVEGVTVRAQCGIGTLRETGSAVTGPDGRYRLTFGPGMWSDNETMVQAATISVYLKGHFEKNLHRQGDMLAAMKLPEDGEIGWGDKTVDDVFLPGRSKVIDFVMLPATRMEGIVLRADGDRMDGVRVSLVGEDMPPSSSVVANTKADKGGRIELNEIPTGFRYQILVEPYEAKSPWLAWASAPMVFAAGDDGGMHVEYSVDGKPVDFSCRHLHLILNGNGVNWKTALKDAANKKLELKWNGLSTDRVVQAGMASLELGDKDE